MLPGGLTSAPYTGLGKKLWFRRTHVPPATTLREPAGIYSNTNPSCSRPVAELWRVEDSLDLYGINRWGRDYFSANRKGHLVIRPSTTASTYADVKEIVDALRADGIQTPILLRFPQLIGD